MLGSGDTQVSVYRSEFAGTNKATALNFEVDDMEAEFPERSRTRASPSNIQ